MKKFILLVFLIFAVFLYFNRQKLFVRDPLANVTRDGVKEAGAQVYINYSNEIILKNDNEPAYMTVVQYGNRVGTPLALKGLLWTAFLSSDEIVPSVPAPKPAMVESMSNTVVQFKDAKGREVVVALR